MSPRSNGAKLSKRQQWARLIAIAATVGLLIGGAILVVTSSDGGHSHDAQQGTDSTLPNGAIIYPAPPDSIPAGAIGPENIKQQPATVQQELNSGIDCVNQYLEDKDITQVKLRTGLTSPEVQALMAEAQAACGQTPPPGAGGGVDPSQLPPDVPVEP